jgi:hypothetical protein
VAAWGPIEFSATEVAVILAFVGLVPPFVIAFVGSFVHSLVIARRDGDVTLLSLFLRWWMWCTLGWIGAWFLAVLFN